MSERATRRQFALMGLAGAALASLLALLLAALTPGAGGWPLLAAARWGSPMPTVLFLLALGFIAVAEWPVMLFALVRLARSRAPDAALLAVHFFYVFFPVVYGALGAWLTGERWWFAVMALLAWLRLSTSLLGVRPRPALAPPAAPETVAPTVPDGAAPRVVPLRDEGARRAPLRAVRGFVLDMDGVLYRGNQPREGAVAFVRFLNEQGIPYVCLTNNASRTSEMYEQKLHALGIPISGDCVVGAARAAAEWLAVREPPGSRVLPIGEAGLRQELVQVGFTLVEAPPADVVVTGIDFGLSYEKLKRAALAIRAGAHFVGTNPDTTFPSEEGLVPGNGATLAFLEAATGVKPTITGKPQRAMMEVALTHVGLPAAQVAMVGDRLDTDILGGQRVGMATILLRGGVTSDAELESSAIRPDHVFDDLAALLAAYGHPARNGQAARVIEG